MAAFSRNECRLVERDCRLDYKLLRTGGVAFYWANHVLAEDLAWLRTQQYAIHEFDGCNWRVEADFHDDLAKALQFPDYYGRNLNAFKDCMDDVEVPDDGGMVILIRNIEAVERYAVERHDPEFLWDVVDILGRTTRANLLFGRRFVTLLQSRNPARIPGIDFSGVGAVHADWNPREWLNSKRGVHCYPDGQRVFVGDVVRFVNDRGVVVGVVGSGHFLNSYKAEDYADLGSGVLVRTDRGALVLFVDDAQLADMSFVLERRGASNNSGRGP